MTCLAGNGAGNPLETEVGSLGGDTQRLPGASPQDDLRRGQSPGEGPHEGHQGQGRHHHHPLCNRVQVNVLQKTSKFVAAWDGICNPR